jgi:hypothetical protein
MSAAIHQGDECPRVVANVTLNEFTLLLLQKERVRLATMERYDLVARTAKLLGQMSAEEPCTARQKDAHFVVSLQTGLSGLPGTPQR